MNVKGKCTYFNGDVLMFTGETEEKYGVTWYIGVSLEAYNEGARFYVEKKNIYLYEYDELVAGLTERNALYRERLEKCKL